MTAPTRPPPLVLQARTFGRLHLRDILRRSGEDYATHGDEVAETLREMTMDPLLLASAVLHDLLVHPEGHDLLRQSPLPPPEQSLVRRMHALRRLHIDERTDDLDTVINAFAEEPRILPLRMAHRLNDVRHLNRFDTVLRQHIARETLHMYAAMAGRLGFQHWKNEMETRCFREVHPKAEEQIRSQFAAMRDLDSACLRQTKRFLARALREGNIAAELQERRKSPYSTYRKMIIKRRKFHELTDRLAIRVLVETPEECYRALGVVHATMHPIPGKLKDYIGSPKENGYRSIHTVVYPLPGVTEQPIEVQIRSRDMHRECEFGPAGHGSYKYATYALQSNTTRVHLLLNLENLRQESRSLKHFEEALRTYFRDDHLAIFDHRNTLYHLQRPSSALDFVCHVYAERSAKLKSLRINGRERGLGTDLRDGDTVEARFGRARAIAAPWPALCHRTKHRKMLQALL